MVAVALVVVLTGGSDRGTPGGRERAAGFRLESLTDPGSSVELAAFRGRPVLLNFWASWCTPCVREMPALERLHRRLGDRITFLGVNHEDSRRAALRMLERTGATYPSAYDPDGTVAPRYGLRRGLPVTVFVSADGRIVGRRLGELSGRELASELDRLFPR